MNRIFDKKEIQQGKRMTLLHGDITEEQVDAIVNAANSYLKHGGGVAGAIVRKGGYIIQEESNKIGFVPVGQCAITTGGTLAASYVIHTVGPRWREGNEHQKLKSAVLNTLNIASEKGFKSLSLPAISSGIFGFPKAECAEIILTNVRDYLQTNDDSTLQEVRICLYDESTVNAFKTVYEKIFQD
jgi:O-acetyl-ADP-ribose deacetylase (regulator of RNase III)